MKIIKTELLSCFKRKEIHFVMLFLVILSLLAYSMECIAFYGSELRFIRSSNESTILSGVYSNSVRVMIMLMLPFISSLIYSDSFYRDYHNGVLKGILTRVRKSDYILSQAAVVFVSSFLTFFIAFFLNLVIVKVPFPAVGFDNNLGLPPFDIAIQNYNEKSFLDFIRIQSPFGYNLLNLFILSFFAGLLGLFTYGVYFLLLDKNRIYGMFFSFICYIASTIGFSVLGFWNFSLTEQLQPMHEGTALPLIIWGIILAAVSVYLIVWKGIKNEVI